MTAKHFSQLVSASLLILFVSPVFAQHDHGGAEVKAPKIFLDKSPRIVEYQLKRLSNEQLLAVERETTDEKYVPVYRAILMRDGMSRGDREEALSGLVTINDSNPVVELVEALTSLKSGKGSDRIADSLARLLLAQDVATLESQEAKLRELAEYTRIGSVSSVGYASLISAGKADAAWELASEAEGKLNLLGSLRLVTRSAVLEPLHAPVTALTEADNVEVQNAAVSALAYIPSNREQTFLHVAGYLGNEALREAAVKTLLAIPKDHRESAKSQELIEWLVDFAESTPASDRTSDSFLDAMQLVDELLASAPSNFSKPFRQRLRETVVRVVRIHTVEEEMRYDIPYFAVEAGRPVQVVLINEDLMPHNLVFTVPGALQEVAEAGLAQGPTGGKDGKQYVPDTDQVLFATNMIATETQEAITFDAPTEPGEYPYVCTFPRHWMRMYGVMVVVEDLDAWQKNPTEPKDPIGSNRSFVQAWKMEDFAEDDMEQVLRGRSPEIGARIFAEATCAQCHKAGELPGGNVGPALNEIYAKEKADDRSVLQSIIDPSHTIDKKYSVYIVLDADDKTTTGLILEENDDKVVILENPEAKEPTVILQDDIEDIIKSANSMMPKGLMNRYSKDEILELLAYLRSVQKT